VQHQQQVQQLAQRMGAASIGNGAPAPAPRAAPAARPAPAPAARPAPAPAPPASVSDDGMSKSQKKRLRKAKRDGKAAA
jgi:hypothetical protein